MNNELKQALTDFIKYKYASIMYPNKRIAIDITMDSPLPIITLVFDSPEYPQKMYLGNINLETKEIDFDGNHELYVYLLPLMNKLIEIYSKPTTIETNLELFSNIIDLLEYLKEKNIKDVKLNELIVLTEESILTSNG
jgi:hypothetical protein